MASAVLKGGESASTSSRLLWGVPDQEPEGSQAQHGNTGQNQLSRNVNGGLDFNSMPSRIMRRWSGDDEDEDEDEDKEEDEEGTGGLERKSRKGNGYFEGSSRSASPPSPASGEGGGKRRGGGPSGSLDGAAPPASEGTSSKGRSWLFRNAGASSLGRIKSLVTEKGKVVAATTKLLKVKVGRRKSELPKKSQSWTGNMSMSTPSQDFGDGGEGGFEGDASGRPEEEVASKPQIPGLVGFQHLEMFDECLEHEKPTREKRKDFLVTVFSTVDAASDASTRSFLSSEERWAAVATQVVAMASIRHPNIASVVSIYEFNGIFALIQAPGRPLCMHYEWMLQGETYGSTPPLPPSQILSWASDLSQAVLALHRNDPVVLHRRICPHSIILDPDTMTLKLGQIGSCALLFHGSEQRVKGSDDMYKLEAVPDADPRFAWPLPCHAVCGSSRALLLVVEVISDAGKVERVLGRTREGGEGGRRGHDTMCVSVCVCVRAYVRACVHACTLQDVRGSVPECLACCRRYIAPEAIEYVGRTAFATGEYGDQAEYGPSSDVFSLGATFYYIATGLDPLDEYEDEDVAHMMRMGQRPDPNEQGVGRL